MVLIIALTTMREHLSFLESEAISIIREASAQFRNPVILFSGGKDSACVLHLAVKAFQPMRIPFRLLHVDTGHNFPEVLVYRDRVAKQVGVELIVARVQDSIDRGRATDPGPHASRNALQAITLMDTIAELKLDALLGGARRDEEKARAKERIFSVRDEFGQWDPKNQRPELWSIYNGRLKPGGHMRVFPLSNWTEQDVWRYVEQEGIELPGLYFSHRREVVRKKDGTLLALAPFVRIEGGEHVADLAVRCRTVGDILCTGLIESSAATPEEVLREIRAARTTERGSRQDDQTSESSMEERKREGYF